LTQYQILYWHDIPLQVRARQGRQRVSHPLAARFQSAVDNASMEAGLTGDDDYMALLKWSDPEEREGDPDEVAAAIAAEIEAQYPRIDWMKTASDLAGK